MKISPKPIFALTYAALLPFSLHAQLFWDTLPNEPVVDGGSGRWNLATPNWNDLPANLIWNASSASYSGLRGGLVVLDDSGGALQAVALTFAPTADGSSFTLVSDPFDGIANDDTLVLTGAGGVVTVNADALLKNRLGGTVGLTKEGAGTLVLLNTANPFTGNVAVNAGVLAFIGQGTVNPSVFGAGAKTILFGGVNSFDSTTTIQQGSSRGGSTLVVRVLVQGSLTGADAAVTGTVRANSGTMLAARA